MRETLQQNKHEEPSLNLPVDLENQLGHNAVLRRLIQEKVPLTVKNYVDMNYWGNLPDQIDEDERDVIDALRRYEKSQATKFGPEAARNAVKIAKQQAGRR